ncbi:MAG TPA: MBL fold metallo-hydrolase [Segeticoccus sp.]|uniref:MBL fold metallo-hydrolase n=1 Tax=Segeticoccus sp. TaxID=2706531 RepID=UPI002D7F3FBD|nr:MBL fold metallo-hydrolase [Segeticoccus sp.]HET8600446.1 MBL fold metallo-hydrolase [Segeticoccus sp.]
MADGWIEVGDRCWVRRFAHVDVSAGVIAGEAGLLVLDTRASLRQGEELAAHVRALSGLPVLAVLNSHEHFDHTWGNGAFPGLPIVAHESVPAAMRAGRARIERLYAEDPTVPFGPEVVASPLVVPTQTFRDSWSLDLGGRAVTARFLGRGHTAGDVVLHVPDAEVLYAGDLIEESAPPSFGDDCYPLEWAPTLERVAGLLGERTVVVPGHGAPVGTAYLRAQRDDIATVAAEIRRLRGTAREEPPPVAEALRRGRWPWKAERLGDAVARGFAQLADG